MAITDENGALVTQGSLVVLKTIPSELTNGLPLADVRAIEAQKNTEMIVAGFDDYGHVELEFVYEGNIHFIWVAGHCLAVVK